MNALQLKQRSWMEKSAKELEKVHQEEALSGAISNLSNQGVDLSWKTLWFFSSQISASKASTALIQRSLGIDFSLGPTKICKSLS